MPTRPLLCLLALWVLCRVSEERQLHRLVGGHFRIFPDNSDEGDLVQSASGSKDKKTAKGEDEEKKTLSQQVADGKYGLIQKELFSKPAKRPGVISYDRNPEVPNDNVKNLGGLSKNDIWLAENHLLVLRGGAYPPHSGKNAGISWPAIDDYKAPNRQVKIPAHPKVPPPFPVRLSDDGPLQILGTNSSRTINGTLEEAVYALPPPEGYEPGTGPFFPPDYPYSPNATSGQAALPIPPLAQGEYLPGVPFPPFNLNGTLPPFFASLPPGAAVLPPPNQTDDEDDPSIYYPPPYSFYYPKDNSSVPAGPLVPGIILPPPPNFFGALEETTTTLLPQIRPTTTPLPPTVQKPRVSPAEINNELTTPKVVTVLPVVQIVKKNRTRKPPAVTILKPVYGPSTTQAPYYDIETNSIPPEKFHISNTRRPKTTTNRYYYYEEKGTKRPQDYVYVTARPYNTQRPRYRFVQQTPKTDTFSVHIARLQKQIHQYYTTPRPYRPPKPVYQFSFEAANYQQDKFRPLPKYSVQIQPAIEIVPSTPRPVYYQTTTEDLQAKERNPYEVTPNPVYQGYYTKPDEGYFDENTKKYFTSFGRKIPGATTPIPQKSLEGDTAVNYLPPRPNVNPHAEFVNPNYPQVAKYSPSPRPAIKNEGPEIVKAVQIAEGQDGSFISYQLPGDDGAHFYFLTPQLAQSRDQGAGYYYSRVRRDRAS